MTKTINDFIEEIVERDLSEGEALNYLNQRGISISNLEYYRQLQKYKNENDTLAMVQKEMFRLYKNIQSSERIDERITLLKEIISLETKRRAERKKYRWWWNRS
jgi:hypothetical protein